MTLLLDSSVLCAFINPKDVHHLQARTLMQAVLSSQYGNVLFTDYIFDETVTVLLRKVSKDAALEMGTYLLQSGFAMAPIESSVFNDAWKLFQQLEMSFTDCTSLAFLKSFKVEYIATFDKGFRNKGVKVVGV
ncbi:MAG: PIN domain-containing protein [Nanoarchaeota archaeon]